MVVQNVNRHNGEMWLRKTKRRISSGQRDCESLRSLFGIEIGRRYRVLEQRIVAGDHGDAAVSHVISLPVGLGVIADHRSLGHVYVAVENGLADFAVTSYVRVREENTVFDLGKGVDAHIWRKHAVAH